VKLIAALAAGLALYAGAALAQEKVMRVALPDTVATLSYYHDPSPATQFLESAVYDALIAYDLQSRTYQPLLAKSWKRIDDRTLEFELRVDVNWHDGVRFDVDDAVYTFNWLADESQNLRAHPMWSWIDHAEKLGPTKFRLFARRPTPSDLARLAFATSMLPEHKHGLLLRERFYFGHDPIGTGPYRALRVERTGIQLQRNDVFAHGGTAKPAGTVQNFLVHGENSAADARKRFVAGEADLLVEDSAANASASARAVNGVTTPVQGYAALVLSFEARERAADTPIADDRVRHALLNAIDRSEIAQGATQGASGIRLPQALCWTEQAGCGAAPTLPSYDPIFAKQILQEAGFGDGFGVEITAQGPQAAEAARLIAKRWEAIGVTAPVIEVDEYGLLRKQKDGKIEAQIIGWPAGEMPDVARTVETYFALGETDLHNDDALHALAAASEVMMDDPVRREAVRQALEQANDNAYLAVLGPYPTWIAHSPLIGIEPRGRYGAYAFSPLDLRWK
jgi:peptide/nickel transport system substrate-binding protein